MQKIMLIKSTNKRCFFIYDKNVIYFASVENSKVERLYTNLSKKTLKFILTRKFIIVINLVTTKREQTQDK